jgi:hypothetical protein
MKKLLLTVSVIALTYLSSAQIIVRGISPSSIAVNYEFSWADPTGNPPSGWGTPNWNLPGSYVQGNLVLVDDGTPGLNAQGHPLSASACSPIINDLTGKIAVLYRYDGSGTNSPSYCGFSDKALNAQNAGAIGVIIINREPGVAINMSSGTAGADVTIPVVLLSDTDGAALVGAMENEPVEMFMGNKQNLFSLDGGANREEALISRYGSIPLSMANNNYSFAIGLQMYNFGSADTTFTINAEITDPNGNTVYNESVSNAPIISGDTLAMFTGATYSFPDYTMSNATVGQYTLKYTISVDNATDQSEYDNVILSSFNVTDDVLSLARQNSETGKVLINSFPRNAESSYQACIRLQDFYPNSTTGIAGLYFAVGSSNDTIENEPVTAEIYEWNDTWTEIGDSWANITFNDLNPIGAIDYVCTSNADNEKVVYAPFAQSIPLVDDQRYLICLTTYNPEIGFGYDNGIAYDANLSIYSQPISPLNIDGATWYSGWSGSSAFSLGMKIVGNAGSASLNSVDGIAYPNPANDFVTVSVESTGKANLTVSDISGKVAYIGSLDLINGKAEVNISKLDAGIYVFNVTLENGKTSQFNVVKK